MVVVPTWLIKHELKIGTGISEQHSLVHDLAHDCMAVFSDVMGYT
jgi:hypothetical protein